VSFEPTSSRRARHTRAHRGAVEPRERARDARASHRASRASHRARDATRDATFRNVALDMSTRRRRATTATATTSRDDDALAEELFRSLRDAVRASAREANARRQTDGRFDRWLYAEIFWRF